MTLVNPILALVRNNKKGTYHPVVFGEQPYDDANNTIIHKSEMLQYNGFQNKEYAIRFIHTVYLPKAKSISLGETTVDLELKLAWDGEGFPSYTLSDGKLTKRHPHIIRDIRLADIDYISK